VNTQEWIGCEAGSPPCVVIRAWKCETLEIKGGDIRQWATPEYLLSTECRPTTEACLQTLETLVKCTEILAILGAHLSTLMTLVNEWTGWIQEWTHAWILEWTLGETHDMIPAWKTRGLGWAAATRGSIRGETPDTTPGGTRAWRCQTRGEAWTPEIPGRATHGTIREDTAAFRLVTAPEAEATTASSWRP